MSSFKIAKSRWSLVIVLFVTALCVNAQQNVGRLEQPASRGTVWECNFIQNACHFRNQYNLARFSRYYNSQTPFYEQKSALVLDLSTSQARRFPGARLISHYFPAKYLNACLYISYLMTGKGPKSFYLIQQDKENKCIYADENERRDNNDQWRHIQLQLELSDGDPRFFIEAQYNSGLPGYIAVSRFSYAFGNCERNDVNHCYADFHNPDSTGAKAPGAV